MKTQLHEDKVQLESGNDPGREVPVLRWVKAVVPNRRTLTRCWALLQLVGMLIAMWFVIASIVAYDDGPKVRKDCSRYKNYTPPTSILNPEPPDYCRR